MCDFGDCTCRQTAEQDQMSSTSINHNGISDEDLKDFKMVRGNRLHDVSETSSAVQDMPTKLVRHSDSLCCSSMHAIIQLF